MVQLVDGRAERESVAARRLRETRAVDKPPTPVDVLTGFLGAGKTTLVQKLLANPPNGARIGVIVNDLAATNIDALLLAENRSEDDGVVRLQNGCACCSLGGGLLDALDNLRRGGERRGYEYDQVVVECSGVARPQNIIRLLAGSPVQRMSLRHLVAVVDTAAFHRALASREIASTSSESGQAGEKVAQLLADQLEVADSVILNKLDLCSSEVTGEVERLVRGFSPGAAIQRSRFSEVDLEQLFKTSNSLNAASILRADVASVHALDLQARYDEDRMHGSGHAEGHGESYGAGNHGEGHGESLGDGHHGCPDGCDGHSSSNSGGHIGHGHSHGHARSSTEEHGGLSSFVYRSDTPLDPERLGDLFAAGAFCFVDAELPASCSSTSSTACKDAPAGPLSHVLRSKGFVRLSGDASQIYFWSLAGTQFHLRPYSPFSSAAFTPPELLALKGAEVVFIGPGVREIAAEIAATLDACLSKAVSDG